MLLILNSYYGLTFDGKSNSNSPMFQSRYQNLCYIINTQSGNHKMELTEQ